MPVSTIFWEGGIGGHAKMVDQTLLPGQFTYLECHTVEEVWTAIKRLSIRGAPAIGIAAAFGLFLGVRETKAKGWNGFLRDLEKARDYLGSSRPTAVNLFWALARMERTAREHREAPVEKILEILLNEAKEILEEDRRVCRELGRIGSSLVNDGDTLLTYCNAGGLATADYGTALAVFFRSAEDGKKIKVFAGETRPLLQGSRLTAWELQQANIDVTLVCDNMIAHVMKNAGINAVFVGADRIAANGDGANKIGTYAISVLAEKHGIPFYMVAPVSTFDLSIPNGGAIPIEERDGEEIANAFGKRTAPMDVSTYNPAFDVTPAELISAIITEKGIIRNPDPEKIKKFIL